MNLRMNDGGGSTTFVDRFDARHPPLYIRHAEAEGRGHAARRGGGRRKT